MEGEEEVGGGVRKRWGWRGEQLHPKAGHYTNDASTKSTNCCKQPT